MSAIGFTPQLNEIEALREAYGSMNDVARNLASAARCIKKQDLRVANHHLRAAELHLDPAKEKIVAVGRAKNKS